MAEPGPGRVYLDVPYREKDAAKANGARWDSHARRWYDPRPHTPVLQRWAARPDVPEVLAGEDRSFGQGLFVDLVPSSCWFTNVRSCVTDSDWERLRRPILRRVDHRCEACGHAEDHGSGRGLEVHERWHYDYERNVQSLRRLIALCPACHSSTHLGYAAVTGRDREAIAHLQAVTGMTDSQAREHITTAYEVWAVRSVIEWELDLSILTVAGIGLRPPPTATERPEIAEQRLVGARAEDTTAAPAGDADADVDAAQHELAAVDERGPAPVSVPAPRPAIIDDDLTRRLADTGWHGGPDDLARNAPGIGVTHEATRRRHTEGTGADLSWRVGADGEATVAEILDTLTTPSRLDRFRRRAPGWRVVHSVPVGTGRGDIDHVLIGPPGVVTINTKHHRAAKIRVNGEHLQLNGHATDYVPKARREAARATALLTSALHATGHQQIATHMVVRSVIAVVGARVLVEAFAPRVAVLMTRELVHHLGMLPVVLNPGQVETVYALARHCAVWARTLT